MPASPSRKHHIVVFKEACPENTELCESLGIETNRAPIEFTIDTEWARKSQSLMFENLGVMNAFIPETLLEQLDADPAVKGVYESSPRRFELFRPITQKKTEQEVEDCSHTYAERQLQALGIDTNSTISSNQNVQVAVLDTGIDLEHPDFLGKVESGVNAISLLPWEGVQDKHGHGTHCAGKIAGPRHPYRGPRYGVAPDANLLIGKVIDSNGYYEDHRVICGIYWAYLQGAKIISLCLGSERAIDQPAAQPYEEIANRLLSDNQNGALIVAAGGNGSSRPYHFGAVRDPAAAKSVMGVASLDHENKVAPHSPRQLDQIGKIDLSAPGVDVYSSWKGGGYDCETGTSMATAQIAGLAALHLEANPDFTPKELWRSLVSTASPIGCDLDYGAGLGQAP